MALTVFNVIPAQFQPQNSGNLIRPGERGTGVISGTTKQGPSGGTAAICRVYLFTADMMWVAFARTGSSGTYTFANLPVGRYMILVQDDQQDAWRPKVELVTIT